MPNVKVLPWHNTDIKYERIFLKLEIWDAPGENQSQEHKSQIIDRLCFL